MFDTPYDRHLVEHALKVLRRHYATDGFVDPRLAEDEKKKQEQQQAIDVAKQIKAIDAGGPTIAGSQPATTEDMAAAINAGVARGDNSLFGDNNNTGKSNSSGFLGNGVLNGYANAAGNLVGGAGSALTNLSQGNFVNAVGDVIGGAGKAAGSIANGYVNGISNIGNTIVDTAKSGYNAISNAFTPAPQYVDMPLPPSRPEEFRANNSPTVTTAAAPVTPSAPAAPAAPAPQATRGITFAEEVPPAQTPAPIATAVTNPAQAQAATSMMFGPSAGVNQSFQNQAPTLSMPGFQPYSDVMAPYSNTLGAQGAAPNFGGMPGSVSGYPGMAQQQEQISGLNQMPMSANVVPEATIGSQAYGPTLNQTQAEMLGFDRVSDADKFAAWQNEADRVANLGFENNPITGQTDISNYNSPSFTSDPDLVGTSPDSVSFGGLTPGGASAAINEAVNAGDTTMFGESNTANYGPAGGVEVEGNAPEGTGQEGAPEGDGGGGAPEGGGTGDGEKRGGKVGVNRNDTFVNYALKVSSKFGSDAAKRSVKKAKAARWTHR